MIAEAPLAVAPPPTLGAGEILAGRYRIVACLGQGSVGEVYEAEDLEVRQRIAVKVLRPDVTQDERILRRFEQETQLARRLSHPSLCRTYDLGHHSSPKGTRVFLTMELLRGETLEARLARRRLTPAEALPIVRQIAEALAAAHAAGIVHRDLKSSNVFLVADPGAPGATRAVVTDFGFAWNLEQDGSSETLTKTGELIGSPAYMAPEQVRGEKATPAADIYALGVVLYEMVTGELPFVGKSAFYTALMRLQEDPPAPRAKVPELDPVWESVILRCLQRAPADRFADLREIVSALEEGTPAAPPQGEAGSRRGRWLGLTALLPFVLAGTVALLFPFVPLTTVAVERSQVIAAAQAAEQRGALAQALTLYKQALAAELNSGDGRTISSLYRKIGSLQLRLGLVNDAHESYQEAYSISREQGDKEGERESLEGLAAVDRELRRKPGTAAPK